ncbi:MAG TPA: DUF6316 family protein [Pseudomonadales bacterium]
MQRSTDPEPATRFRSERFFRSDDQWFFTTREGTTEGPFSSREEAQSALADYLRRIGAKPSDVWTLAGDNR